MITFSAPFKDAFKMALAMVIAYAIALSQGWGTPFWAGFAVAFCGLTGVGESLNKGMLRVFGTLFGATMGLALLSLFPQDRWAFMLTMSLFVAFCTYMMGGTTRWYFWFMAGITVPIVAVTAEPNAVYDFDRAVLRSQQTTLGIVVYTLVSILIWPVNSRRGFEGAVRGAVDDQRRLLSLYMEHLTGTSGKAASGQDAAQEATKLRADLTRTLASLPTKLDQAELDTYEIWEVRRTWHGFIAQLGALQGTLEAWRQLFHELDAVDAERLIPALPALRAELDARLKAIADMLSGEMTTQPTLHADLACEVDRDQLATLPHFQQSAVLLAASYLTRLEQETRALFDAASDIRGLSTKHAARPALGEPVRPSPLDPDRLIGVLRQTTVLWLTLLLYIYVPDLPAASALVIVSAVFVMLLALHPQIPARVFLWPMAFGIVLGAVAHIFVMPHLSGFLGLGTMLFVTVFALVYLLYSPRHHAEALLRARLLHGAGVHRCAPALQLPHRRQPGIGLLDDPGQSRDHAVLPRVAAPRGPLPGDPAPVPAQQRVFDVHHRLVARARALAHATLAQGASPEQRRQRPGQARQLGARPAAGGPRGNDTGPGAGPGHQCAGHQRPPADVDARPRRAPIRGHGAGAARGRARLAHQCPGDLRPPRGRPGGRG